MMRIVQFNIEQIKTQNDFNEVMCQISDLFKDNVIACYIGIFLEELMSLYGNNLPIRYLNDFYRLCNIRDKKNKMKNTLLFIDVLKYVDIALEHNNIITSDIPEYSQILTDIILDVDIICNEEIQESLISFVGFMYYNSREYFVICNSILDMIEKNTSSKYLINDIIRLRKYELL